LSKIKTTSIIFLTSIRYLWELLSISARGKEEKVEVVAHGDSWERMNKQ